MRVSGNIVASLLQELKKLVKPGITTEVLDQFSRDFLKKQDCTPAFLGYHGYPATICTSVNEEVVHGIPSKRVLREGDIVGVDVGAFYKGYCGDSARTYPVGRVGPEIEKLLNVTSEALEKGIEQCQVGNRVSDIGHAIQEFVESHGYSVVRD